MFRPVIATCSSQLRCHTRRFQSLLRRPSLPFWHRTHYGKAIIQPQKSSASGEKFGSLRFLSKKLPDKRAITKLPTNLDVWRMPGDAEAEEQIWRNLDGLFRDGGFALWPNV